MNIKASECSELSAAEANRLLYAKIATQYDQSEECVVDIRLQRKLRTALELALATLSQVTDSPRILDAGGGAGNATLILMSLGFRALNVDISPEMLAIFRTKAMAQGHAPESVTAEMGEFLRTDGRYWDMIVFSSALHHLDDPEAMLDLARARTNPGGVIVTMYDPIRVGPVGRRLRRMDYMLHVVVRTPRRFAGLVRDRFVRGGADRHTDDRLLGDTAERHACLGLDDLALRDAFVRQDWTIVEHRRSYEGRFGVTRLLCWILRQRSSFSFIVQRPPHLSCGPTQSAPAMSGEVAATEPPPLPKEMADSEDSMLSMAPTEIETHT